MGKLQIGAVVELTSIGWASSSTTHLLATSKSSFYAQHLTIEIDFSFYKLPERSVFESLCEQTLEKFAVKGRYHPHNGCKVNSW